MATRATLFQNINNTVYSNDYNYVACDWMLSRMAMILIPGNYSTLYNNSTKICRRTTRPTARTTAITLPMTAPSDLTPLSTAWFKAAVSGGLTSSRLDLAIPASSLTYNASANVIRVESIRIPGAPIPPRIAGMRILERTGGRRSWRMARYQASPFILAGTTIPKITPATLATCSPDLIRGCSSFVVEYACNFYTKKSDGSGAAAANLPNGQPPDRAHAGSNRPA